MRELDDVFARLRESGFRRRFRLRGKDLDYYRWKGLATVREHAAALVAERLAPAAPANDGAQTPMRGHPVFLAQHATATCCRGCLETWHGIPKGRALTREERAHVVRAIERWLLAQAGDAPGAQTDLGL